jgi:hypothetical protein
MHQYITKMSAAGFNCFLSVSILWATRPAGRDPCSNKGRMWALVLGCGVLNYSVSKSIDLLYEAANKSIYLLYEAANKSIDLLYEAANKSIDLLYEAANK